MHASLLFWTLLTLPGYTALRHLDRAETQSGLLGALAVSSLLSLGLLSPVSILCYVLQAPLWIFSVFTGVLIFAAAIEITRQGWWGDMGRMIAAGFGLELIVVAVDLVGGARAGAFFGGDAIIHLARMRTLLDHGFNNFDPFLGPDYFFPMYHTSLYHALFAACSWITGIPLLFVWFSALVWAKVLVVAGAYYLAWCCFERSWPAWLAAMFTIGWRGHVIFLVYPNKIAPLWICACMIGFAVRAIRPSPGWAPAGMLAMGSLVLGQVHALYGAFAGLVLGPVLACVAGYRLVRGLTYWAHLLAGIVGLFAALPFLLIAKAHSNPVTTPVVAAQTDEDSGDPVLTATAQPDSSLDASAPRAGWMGGDWRAGVLLVGIVCGLVGSRRKEVAVVLGVVAIAAVIQYVPPIRAASLEVFRLGWIVNRLGFVLDLGTVLFVAAAPGFLLSPRLTLNWQRSVVSLFAVALGVAFLTSTERGMWRVYWRNVPAPSADRMARYTWAESVTEQCRRYIPRGVCVLAPLQSSMPLVMLHDCRIVAPSRGSAGVRDVGERRKHVNRMLAEDTPWEERRDLLRKYGVEYFYVGDAPHAWTRGHVKAALGEGPFRVLRLNTD